MTTKKIILLSTLIPVGVGGIATAIAVPLVLNKKGGGEHKPTSGEYTYNWKTSGEYKNTIPHSTLKYCDPTNFNDTYLADVANNNGILAADIFTSLNALFNLKDNSKQWDLNATISNIAVTQNNSGYVVSFKLKAVFDGYYSVAYYGPTKWKGAHQHKQELDITFSNVKIVLSNTPWTSANVGWGIKIDLDNTLPWTAVGSETLTVDDELLETYQLDLSQSSDAATKQAYTTNFVTLETSVLGSIKSTYFIDVASKIFNVTKPSVEGYTIQCPDTVTNKDTSIKLKVLPNDKSTKYYPAITVSTSSPVELSQWQPADPISGDTDELEMALINDISKSVSTDIQISLFLYEFKDITYVGELPTGFSWGTKPQYGYWGNYKIGFGDMEIIVDDNEKVNKAYNFEITLEDNAGNKVVLNTFRKHPGDNKLFIPREKAWQAPGGGVTYDWSAFKLSIAITEVETKTISNFSEIKLPSDCTLIHYDGSSEPANPYIEKSGDNFVWTGYVSIMSYNCETYNNAKKLTAYIKQGQTQVGSTFTHDKGKWSMFNQINISGNWADLTGDSVTISIEITDPQQ